MIFRKKPQTQKNLTKTTINELCRLGTQLLDESGRENAGFDARCLIEKALGTDTAGYMLRRSEFADTSLYNAYLGLIRRRATGEPLQYILGRWAFMDSEFLVGEGVLIPRPETELLVEFAADFLKGKKKPVVFDLCSGSGCIAVSVAKLFHEAQIYAVEKYDEAFSFLKKNIELNGVENVTAVQGDIFNEAVLSAEPDLILSNPPYIRTDEIPLLQQEVRREPVTALDGGKDGYIFYDALVRLWLPKLKKGGAMAVECGEEQADEISQMFFLARSRVDIINDLSGFPRVVTAVR